MATRVTDGARRFARLPRAYIALTKSEEKERLLAVYQWCKEEGVANNVEELKGVMTGKRCGVKCY